MFAPIGDRSCSRGGSRERNLHLHGKDKQGPFSKTQGLHLDQAVVLDHDCFTDRQSKTDTLLIDATVLLLQFAKALEELSKIFAFDASTRVKDVQDETLAYFVIGHKDLDEVVLCKFQGIFDQVD